MLLTTRYVDGLPLYRFEKVLGRHGVDIPRQTLARWVIQCCEHFQPLLNLMRERLLESPVIHCDETRVQVLKEPDHGEQLGLAAALRGGRFFAYRQQRR